MILDDLCPSRLPDRASISLPTLLCSWQRGRLKVLSFNHDKNAPVLLQNGGGLL